MTDEPTESLHAAGPRSPVRHALQPDPQVPVAAGVPLGFNGLLTIRGRKSGLPRTTPMAIIEVDGRRWVWAPWGEVNWVRNLRAAGRATITIRGRKEAVRATELDPAQRVAFFRDIARSRRSIDPVRLLVHPDRRRADLNHPAEAARGRRRLRVARLVMQVAGLRETVAAATSQNTKEAAGWPTRNSGKTS